MDTLQWENLITQNLTQFQCFCSSLTDTYEYIHIRKANKGRTRTHTNMHKWRHISCCEPTETNEYLLRAARCCNQLFTYMPVCHNTCGARPACGNTIGTELFNKLFWMRKVILYIPYVYCIWWHRLCVGGWGGFREGSHTRNICHIIRF